MSIDELPMVLAELDKSKATPDPREYRLNRDRLVSDMIHEIRAAVIAERNGDIPDWMQAERLQRLHFQNP